jgi:bifunctional UDP-N-acetylglucosamine pyrophosphorylase/glucosamine-1-phosphate N-acetyltransferase
VSVEGVGYNKNIDIHMKTGVNVLSKRMAIVLAAGQGKRMKSKQYKVLHQVCGKPLVGHVADALQQVVERTVMIVGHGAEAVQAYAEQAWSGQIEFAHQEQQLGTGHAVQQAGRLLAEDNGVTFVVCGDTPLIREQTLLEMLAMHQSSAAAATILTAKLSDPTGYGRIVRDSQGQVLRIVEQKDASSQEQTIDEINTGTYCFDNQLLFSALQNITNNNAQQEYYLTDVIGILQTQGHTVAAYCTPDASEAIGINDRIALAEAELAMRMRIVREHMLNGVTIIDPSHTYIEKEVVIGADTVIYPGTVLKGATTIGEDCRLGPNCELTDSVIGDAVYIRHSVLEKAEVGAHTTIGPFAYLRPGSKLGEHVKVGDFVELKNATLGDHSKVSHLSYVGDAKVGKNVNIGCGAITVNYDGYNKHLTEIDDEAFIGSNVNLIAPVKVGKGAYVVAGSTITHEVNENDLAIAREKQVNKPGYAEKLRNRKRNQR